jgi:hypothetical protein
LVKLYHKTARANVASILHDGFRQDDDALRPGVSVADEPPGYAGLVLIVIEADVSVEELDGYAYNRHQWPPNGNPYREWRVPAWRLNQFPRHEVIE